MTDCALFQQKIVEGKTLKVIKMNLNRMLLRRNLKHRYNTEQTLNHEWIFVYTPKATGSSLQAGFGDHLRSFCDQNKLKNMMLLIVSNRLDDPRPNPKRSR